MRAAFERRSLARDVFGIAWGLELNVQTAPASSPSSSIVRVSAGVAYGGDGKPIVLRAQAEVSTLLVSSGAAPSTSWAVYIAYAETAQSGKSGFSFCGQAMDPTVAEATQFIVELFGSPPSDGEREGARAEPQGQLGGQSDTGTSRVQIGVVDFDAAGVPSVRLAPGAVTIPPAASTPTPADLASADAPPAEAEYIGVVASAIVHPRAWTTSRASSGTSTVSPAIEIDAQDGIHLRQKTVLHDAVHATAPVLADKTIVTPNEGLSCVLPPNTGVTAAALLNKAVSYTVTGGSVSSGIDLAGKSTSSAADVPRVIGIAIGTHDDAGNVRVVYSGPAVATLGTDPTTLVPGDWLMLDSGQPGMLIPAASPPTSGTLIAKFLRSTGGRLASVLVALG
jgi:hypothetical protein